MTHADDKKLTLLLRGGLSESEKAKVMEHIAECDECADRMACLTLDMAAVDPPAGMSEDILAHAGGRVDSCHVERQAGHTVGALVALGDVLHDFCFFALAQAAAQQER